MQKWEYLQLKNIGTYEDAYWVDSKGEWWDRGWTEVSLDPSDARRYLRQDKAPYYIKFLLPQKALDELGERGWALASADVKLAVFRRLKEEDPVIESLT